MNLKTAALRLGVHYQTAYRWMRSGQLVAVKVGAAYEVSEAAVARLQAQRAATERMPEGSGPARVISEHLGDTAFVYRRSPADSPADLMVVVYAAHRDPVSEVAASTLGRDPRPSTKLVRRAVTTGELICIAQVPQRELRRRLHPQLHEHLQLSGCYSAVCAPVGATGALLVTRGVPGRPYAHDDLAFVQSIAGRVARADERALLDGGVGDAARDGRGSRFPLVRCRLLRRAGRVDELRRSQGLDRRSPRAGARRCRARSGAAPRGVQQGVRRAGGRGRDAAHRCLATVDRAGRRCARRGARARAARRDRLPQRRARGPRRTGPSGIAHRDAARRRRDAPWRRRGRPPVPALSSG